LCKGYLYGLMVHYSVPFIISFSSNGSPKVSPAKY
jgi:hypothetical protein